MNWVWNHSRSRHGARLVLLAIADCASSDGGNAWPSNAEIARKSGLTERGVRLALSELVKLGELVIMPNAGPHGCNRYRVIMDDPGRNYPPEEITPPAPKSPQARPQDPEESAPPEKSAPRKNATPTPEEIAPGTVIEPKTPKRTTSSSGARERATRIPDDFAVTPEMADWARVKVPRLIAAGRGKDETDQFIDHWHQSSSPNARKLDWPAAWRVWMRRADADLARNGHAPTGARPSTTDQRVAQAQALKAELAGLS